MDRVWSMLKPSCASTSASSELQAARITKVLQSLRVGEQSQEQSTRRVRKIGSFITRSAGHSIEGWKVAIGDAVLLHCMHPCLSTTNKRKEVG